MIGQHSEFPSGPAWGEVTHTIGTGGVLDLMELTVQAQLLSTMFITMLSMTQIIASQPEVSYWFLSSSSTSISVYI